MKFDSLALQKEIKGLSENQVLRRLEDLKPELKKLDNAWMMIGWKMSVNRQNRYHWLRWEKKLLKEQLTRLRMNTSVSFERA